MLPTLHNGDWLLFLRWPFDLADIVLADFGEDGYLVKRITRIVDGNPTVIKLTGDNTEISGTYLMLKEDILGVMVCRLWRAR